MTGIFLFSLQCYNVYYISLCGSIRHAQVQLVRPQWDTKLYLIFLLGKRAKRVNDTLYF